MIIFLRISQRLCSIQIGNMGLVAVVGFLFLLVGLIQADPDDLRSNFELIGYSTNLDNPQYRILDNVRPTYMYVDLDVYLSESRFNGLVQINTEVRENLTQLVVHQNVVSITAINVVNAANQPVPLQVPDSFEIDSYYEIVKINFAQTILPGNYTITIRYRGQINENPVDRGFYKGYYYFGNELREYATTQFQPFHARKAFPCFDEPQFKCPYVISITRDSNLSPTYSNMPIGETQRLAGNRTRETFLPTPIISAYLVAFHVSDFEETNLSGTPARPFGIISRRGVKQQHSYAADMGWRITEELNKYTDIDYYGMGQGSPMKNDHIALPDFPSGAMENWGMVNYREAYLLYDEHTNLNNKVFIARILAHELAHKWFGNLVTCFWWSNLWINESYATFYEYFAAHYADPSLELDEQFIIDQVHRGLNSDASPSATPMNWTAVSNNPSVSSHFSPTSYAKGGAVLRMIENFIGFDNFRNGLRYYLKENAYGIGYPEDVYNGYRKAVNEDPTFAHEFPDVDIGTVLDSWVQNPGAPVLNVALNTETGVITITQERFQLTGSPPNTLWHIPITWTNGANPDFYDIRPRFVMSERSRVIPNLAGQNWVIFNIAQSGYYRVNYDDNNWEMIAAALRNNRHTIHKLNRAQIVNDVLHFIRANKISIHRGFDVLSFLRHETDYYVWAGAIGQFDWIRRRMEHLPRAYEEFNAYLLELIESAVQSLGYEERPTDTTSIILNRMQIMNLACNLGHEGCINDSLAKWNRYRQNVSNLVPVNARRYVYCTGLRNGNAADYQFLYQVYNSSENTADMVVILRTLACTRDAASFQHYLFQSMYNDKIRIHDRTNAFSFALQGNRENFNAVLNFLFANFKNIRDSYGGEARLNIAVGDLSAFLTNFADITAFQNWLYTNQIELRSTFNTGVGVIDTSINNLRWGNTAAPDIFSFLRPTSSTSAITGSFLLIATAVAAQFLHATT